MISLLALINGLNLDGGHRQDLRMTRNGDADHLLLVTFPLDHEGSSLIQEFDDLAAPLKSSNYMVYWKGRRKPYCELFCQK